MRQVRTVHVEDLRKVYVRREDVRRYLDARTFGKGEVPS